MFIFTKYPSCLQLLCPSLLFVVLLHYEKPCCNPTCWCIRTNTAFFPYGNPSCIFNFNTPSSSLIPTSGFRWTLFYVINHNYVISSTLFPQKSSYRYVKYVVIVTGLLNHIIILNLSIVVLYLCYIVTVVGHWSSRYLRLLFLDFQYILDKLCT